jgi:uncharacterized protein YbaR (Trm112 family)
MARDMSDTSPIDAEVLNVFRCPLTRSRLAQEGNELVAEVGGLRYPINDGIPILLIEEAKLPEGVTSLDELKQKFADQIPD